jgi:DNA-dependent protein kinase catalytic subunit
MLWQLFRHAHFSATGPPVSKLMGPVYEQFAKSYKTVMDSYFGNDGKLILKMNASSTEPGSFRKCHAALMDKIAKMPGASKDQGKYPLAAYTKWFSLYEQWAAQTRESIELPGQYTGTCRPDPALHVRIVNFDPIILIMGSLRRPKRLTIHGSDERSRHYLVKGGEDLRMDQRVEQVFSAMNDILRADPATSRRRLALRTYQVAPFTTNLGMLEWVNNTEPLKGLLLASAPPDVERHAAGKYNQNLMVGLRGLDPLLTACGWRM